jgi:tetratricopeptide (TPR) repeat protein
VADDREDIPKGYREIPEEEQKRAASLFEQGARVGAGNNFEYAIEMYLQGLGIDPEAVDAHTALREISLKRKASGGKPLGMLQGMKLKGGKDEKEAMLNAEKLLAYDPGNTDHMVNVLTNAHKGGYYDTVLWIGPELLRANKSSASSGGKSFLGSGFGGGQKESFDKYMILKNVYKDLGRYKEAAEAAEYASAMRPDDMDLAKERKDLSAYETMKKGQYDKARSFRDSVKDMQKQHDLFTQDTDIRTMDVLTKQIESAQAEWQADPGEYSKLSKLVDILIKTELPEHENRAIELLESAYENTKQYRYKFRVGQIRLAQLMRQERALRQAVGADPSNEAVKMEYRDFEKERTQQELEIFREFGENYPTEMSHQYNAAVRLYRLEQFSEAIPILQKARNDPKYRNDATIVLGRAFLDAGYVDEAIDTLRDLIESYELKGDTKSTDMTYWYGRALEQKGDTPTALQAYSRVAQWNFNYRDVQARIKKLRSGG